MSDDEAASVTGRQPTKPATPPVTAQTSEQLIVALKAARRQQQLSQSALAFKVGMSQSSLARIEEGKVIPGLATLLRLATGLDMQLSLQPNIPPSVKIQ